MSRRGPARTWLAVAGLAAAVSAAAGAAGAAPAGDRSPAAEDDPLELLWSHRLDFAAGGAPVVTIRIAEGRHELAFHAAGAMRLRPRRGAPVEVAGGAWLRARVRDGLPSATASYPLLGDAAYADRGRLDAARRAWETRGVKVRQHLTGGVYGIAGHVIDNRRVVLVADGDGSAGWAREFADRALARVGARTPIFSEVVTRPSGQVEVLDPSGALVAAGDGLVTVDAGEGSVTVERVGPDAATPSAAAQDRAFRGRLHLTVDATGRVAAVLAITLEELLRGLVPSEIPAGSAREALKAQAVTARSNVLAQIGTRHLGDPYVLCSDVHCQAYRGEGAQAAATDAAVRATAGEAIFGRADGALVDGVYSAVCGGHGEDNDAVWPVLPSRSLRGHPDLPPDQARAWSGLSDDSRLRAFLAAGPPGWCARAAGSRKDRYRWERRLGPAELDALGATLGIGRVTALEVTGRGVSGRATSIVATGQAGRAVAEGELRIRRLLGNLSSSMFVVDREGDGLVLHGGGWGHGAGMCQWGAIGRAEAGQDYREILRAYFSGAEVARVY